MLRFNKKTWRKKIFKWEEIIKYLRNLSINIWILIDLGGRTIKIV